MPLPDDVTTTDDLGLLSLARAGDRLAFGMLYLRHHAAAWRIACVTSRFSPDAELAVIEGFTRVFSALPEESEEFEPGDVTLRPYVLACVRQAALDRARAAGRAETGSRPATPTAALAGLGADGEVVLSTLEHHVARGALAAVPERSRAALWLADVEALTPGEVAGILGGQPQEMAGLAAGARAEIHAAHQAALSRQEVRADCRFTVDHLDAYRAGTLDPTEGLVVRSHLDRCPPCRMRQGELSNAPAALSVAVPAPPLLGGEAQHHWLTSLADLRPAPRLLPPGLAAGGAVHREPLGRRTATRLGAVAGIGLSPARRLPRALRRAGRAAARPWRPQPGSVDLTGPATGSPGWAGSPGSSGSPTPALPPAWTVPPARATARTRPDRRASRTRPERRAARRFTPVLPAVTLLVAFLAVMLAVPRLMTPATSPGPGGLASPAVKAYVPGSSPGAASDGDAGDGFSPAAAGGSAGLDGTEFAAAHGGEIGEATAVPAGLAAGNRPSVGLISTTVSPGSRPGRPAPRSTPHPVTGPGGTGAVAPAVVPATVTVAAAPVPAPPPTSSPVVTPTASTPPASEEASSPEKRRSPKQDKHRAAGSNGKQVGLQHPIVTA